MGNERNEPGTEVDFDRLADLFHQAAALSSTVREAYLDAECPDPRLRREVVALLAAAEHSEEFLPEGGASSVLFEAVKDTAPLYDDLGIWGGAGLSTGTRLGSFEVIEEVGRGGMGTVYRARRADGAYKQEVAVKVVNRGADTEMVVRRFLREREVLSGLSHPNIARLIDGGSAEDGRPFFVMEFVDGEPLTEYADARSLPLVDRLHLVVQASRAVAFAHRRLVVHRDLKPSNILVAEDDEGRPVVKLLDFGIARLLTDEQNAFLTGAGPGPLTPAYAAPEQIKGTGVTTATDVFALGAVLFELLVGTRLDPEAAGQRPSTELRRRLRTDARAKIADARASTPDRLTKQLRGDLDAIVLKALRPEPEARYASADRLADDLERYLRSEPVVARRGSARYNALKFAQRHHWGVAMAVAFTLIILTAGTLLFFSQQKAVAARQVAEAEASKAAAVAAFLESIFFEGDGAQGSSDATIASVLTNAVQRIDVLSGEPLVQAQMLDVMARVYRAQALYETAERLHLRAIALRAEHLGNDHPLTLEARHHYAYLLLRTERHAEAEPIMQAVLAARRSDGNPDYLVESLGDLAHLLREAGRLQEATDAIDEGLAVLERHPDAGTGHFRGVGARAGFALQRGRILFLQNDLDAAEYWVRNAVDLFGEQFGGDHVYVATTRIALGRIVVQRGRRAEARTMLEPSVLILAGRYGDEHPTTVEGRALLSELSRTP